MRRTRWTSAVTWFIAAAVTSWVTGDLLLRHVRCPDGDLSPGRHHR